MKSSIRMITNKKEVIHLYKDNELGKFIVNYLPNNQRGEFTMKFNRIEDANKIVDQILNKEE